MGELVLSRVGSRLLAVVVMATASSLLVTGPQAIADPNLVNPVTGLNGTFGLPQLHGRASAVAQVTGFASSNTTQDVNMIGTDLGIMWDNGHGEVLTAFGDTAGIGVPNLLQGSLWSWRSNAIVRSNDRDLSDGMNFDSVVTDFVGQTKEVVPSPKIPFAEISRIPTAGVSVGENQFLNLMSVRNWGPSGTWDTNFSGLAVSGDNGENWAPLPETQRPSIGGDRNFQQSAYLKSGGYVYQYGTPPGRFNLGHVARVKEADITRLGEYEYWTGGEWKKGDPAAAAPIVGGVGELSVSYNDYLGQYLMLTTDNANSIVMRRAPNPEGPWSPPEVLVDTRDVSSIYAPYIHPYSAGRDLYFLATVYQNYNVLLLHTVL